MPRAMLGQAIDGKERDQMRSRTEKISTIPEACSGCRMCQLACSFSWQRAYNPAQSRIVIEEGEVVDDTGPFRIAFTDECNDCGICVQYCFYGVLKLTEKGNSLE